MKRTRKGREKPKHNFGAEMKLCLIFLEYATVGYMAKRIQMQKQRFMAIQQIAQEKKLQVDGAQQAPAHLSSGADHGHSHSSHKHGHHHHAPKQLMTGKLNIDD